MQEFPQENFLKEDFRIADLMRVSAWCGALLTLLVAVSARLAQFIELESLILGVCFSLITIIFYSFTVQLLFRRRRPLLQILACSLIKIGILIRLYFLLQHGAVERELISFVIGVLVFLPGIFILLLRRK